MNPREGKLKTRQSRAELERTALAVYTNYGFSHRLVIGMLDFLLGPIVRVFPTKPLPDLSDVRKILVLEQGHLGDVVYLAPFLQNLRRHFPSAHISVLGRPGLKELLEVQNLVNELIPIQFPWAQWLPRWKVYNPFSLLVLRFFRDILRLRRREIDLAFVSNFGDYRPNFALFLTGARRRVGLGFAGGGVFLTDIVEPDLSRVHRAEFSLRLLEHIGIPVTPSEKILSLSSDDAAFGHEFLAKNGIEESDLVVGIHPGAGHAIKQWGEDRFREVAGKIVSELDAKVVWFSDPKQPQSHPAGNNKHIVYASLPLRQFLAVASRCSAFVGNDSGPMHMAAGLGVPVVAIFGPELAEWFGPLGDGHQIVDRKALWCRPCWRKCRFAERYCLTLTSVDDVMQAVCNIVGRPPREKRFGGEVVIRTEALATPLGISLPSSET